MNARTRLAEAVARVVDEHFDELIDEIVTSIEGFATRPRRAQSRPQPSSPARRRTGKRDPGVIAATVERLFGYVSKHPDQRIEEIAKGMGVTTRELALPVKKLLVAKRLRTTGQRRATRYATKT